MNTIILTQNNIDLISTEVIIPLIIVITRNVISFIEIKTKELTEIIRIEKLKKYLSIADDAVKISVIAVS